ncbi:MAG TPA: aminotransferase class IV [Herpetosiphonaceae bacterium]
MATVESARFELLETLRLERGEYSLLECHLDRLAHSARYFGIPLALPVVRAALDEHRDRFPHELRRVRLLVSQDGAPRVESAALPPLPAPPLRFVLADTPIDRHDRWLLHKTTRRSAYEQRRQPHPGMFDVLLWNEQDELTEFTIGNLVIDQAGTCYTPPRESGLLAGTLRAELLVRGAIHERILTRADLASAERIWLINSVRGWVLVQLADTTAHLESGEAGDAR